MEGNELALAIPNPFKEAEKKQDAYNLDFLKGSKGSGDK
jgi:hypothetical protein